MIAICWICADELNFVLASSSTIRSRILRHFRIPELESFSTQFINTDYADAAVQWDPCNVELGQLLCNPANCNLISFVQ